MSTQIVAAERRPQVSIGLLTVKMRRLITCFSRFASIGVVCLAPAHVVIGQTPYLDLPKSHWAYEAVLLMNKMGILTGFPREESDTRVSKAHSALNATYDQLTPSHTWTSLIHAMRVGDEEAVKRILTGQCFAQDDTALVRFGRASEDRTQRLKAYRDLATKWRPRQILFLKRSPKDDANEVDAAFPSERNEMGTMYVIRMRKYGSKWRIVLVMRT